MIKSNNEVNIIFKKGQTIEDLKVLKLYTLMIPFLDRLSSTVLNQLLNVLCNLMNPNKADATRGRHSLAGLMENLAYTSLTGTQCPNPTPPEM